MKKFCSIVGLLLVLVLIPGTSNAEEPQANVVFYAMGDVPYAPEEDVLLPQQIEELPRDAEFLIHVGDIKTGSTPCDEAVYEKVSGMLAKSAVPTFIIPGDNEWNDCDDPAAAWPLWVEYFRRFDQRWQHQLPVFRQLQREENFSFVQGNVLFVGLNLVGGRVQDEREWRRRHKQNLVWCKRNMRRFQDEVAAMVLFGHAHPKGEHDDFFEPFEEEAEEFEKPILYLHGDGHRWMKDRPFDEENILRVQVDQGGIAPPLKVTVRGSGEEVFEFDRRGAE